MGNRATMKVWDVDHGLAVWLHTPNGRDIVIDLGAGSHGSDKTFSPLKHMKKNGVGSIEHLVITHPHADHLDDIMNLDIPVHVFSRPRGLDKATLEKGMDDARKERLGKFFEMDSNYNSAVSAEYKSDVADNWGGLTYQTFRPPVATDEANINNHSIVTVFKFAGIKVVIPGDNEPTSWAALRGIKGFDEEVKDAHVLVAPHHGRESGYDTEAIKLINPLVTIISDKAAETTAVDKYTKASRGWTIHKPDKTSEERKCLTTRKDGRVQVEFWYEDAEKRPYLIVSTL